MSNKKGFIRENLAVGFLLFALFLGAGNIIFPPELGQNAGEQIVLSMLGFLITGVGLPLIAIIAVAKNGGDLQVLGNRVGKKFSLIFTSIVYLAIGPLFAIPKKIAEVISNGNELSAIESLNRGLIAILYETASVLGMAQQR